MQISYTYSNINYLHYHFLNYTILILINLFKYTIILLNVSLLYTINLFYKNLIRFLNKIKSIIFKKFILDLPFLKHA